MAAQKDLFDVDVSEMKKLNRAFDKLTKKDQNKIIAGTLNMAAFETRSYAQKRQIPKTFNLRTGGSTPWVVSSVLVDMAKPNHLVSEVGAKKRWGKNKGKDFWGLRDQEIGKDRRRPIIETIEARKSKQWENNVAKNVRTTNIKNLPNEMQYQSPQGGEHRVISMMRQLDRQNYKGMFRVKKNYRKFKKGVYRFATSKMKTPNDWTATVTRKVRKMIDLSHSTARLKKKPWLKPSVEKAVRPGKLDSYYLRAFEKNAPTEYRKIIRR